jgi:hypothetical protein
MKKRAPSAIVTRERKARGDREEEEDEEEESEER